MKAAFHTLGCKVNQYETELIAQEFRRGGFEIVGEDDFADVYVINTCTVTNLADRKSRQFVRRARKLNPDAVVAVTGCYVQVRPQDLAAIDGVSVICGTNEKHRIFELVEDQLRKRDVGGGKSEARLPYGDLTGYEELGILEGMENRTRAYVKIEEGCDRFCSYCIIPYARGKVRSRRPDEILEEVEGLLTKGYREIVLTGINTALYGTDAGSFGIGRLLRELDQLDGTFRIRLSSLEPTVVGPDEVKEVIRYDRLCHHLHLSLQSGSDSVLRRMNRRYTREEYLGLVSILREFDPLYGVSADIIAGFPGETEEEFEESVRIVSEAELCRTHVFKYSPREGTPAAAMSGQIPGALKTSRSRRLIEAAERAADAFFHKAEGSERTVLFEQREDGRITGYTDNYIKVYADGDETMFNQFYHVKLLKKYNDGMLGEIKAGPGKEKP
jgi:threonylcarbamoyladenosine tRNA methylthiotransferase MtaB